MNEKEIEREKKLNALQSKHRVLLSERLELQKDFKKKSKIAAQAHRVMSAKNEELRQIGQAIFSMKHAGETPHVTDHAIVRYLERVEHIDIWALKDKVSSHHDAVKDGNVIVTVNEDLSEVAK